MRSSSAVRCSSTPSWSSTRALATIGFIASYVAIDHDKSVFVFPLGHINALNFALGLTLGVALFCIGAGAVHWARTLMSNIKVADERHPIEASPEVRAKVHADFKQGAKESVIGRRKLIRNTMLGAVALVPLSGVVLLRDLGPLPEDKLRHTLWSKGKLLVNMNTNEPLRPSDVAVGSLTFAKPEGLEEHDHAFQNEIAKAALMIVRIQPDDIQDKRELEWSHEGIVAYSKICTHVGCPISLYEQQTHPRALPLPPVHLRPVRRCPGRSSVPPVTPCRSCGSARTTRATSKRSATSKSPSALHSGSADEHSESTTARSRGKAPAGERVADWADGRLGIYSLAKANMRKIFPDHWSFMLGEVCLYSFLIIILTGVYLTLFFHPSMNEVEYHGSYVPAAGSAHERGVQVDAGHELRRPGRSADPADPPLGGDRLPRRHVRAHDARLSHRRVPQAA
ncbi:hypothetical protein SFUMM280S_08579 [Streptomyces fumanus]